MQVPRCYHPHIHYLVPGGGLSSDGQTWIGSLPGFFLRVEPLSDHFRACFRQWIEQHAPAQIPPKVWKQRWVAHSQAAGSGRHVLRYLSRYVFKTATGNRLVPQLPDGRLRWNYRDSQNGHWQSLSLEPDELIRRFLQHVLPCRFHRVRRFGWLHPSAKAKRQHVQALLGERGQALATEPSLPATSHEEDVDPFDELERAERRVETLTLPPVKLPLPPPDCPRCHRPMICLGHWQRGQPPRFHCHDPPAIP